LPNLSIEAGFGDWSVLVHGYWAWWQTQAPDYWSYRIQMIWLEGRYWWGNHRLLTGPFSGVYVAGGTYDVRLFPQTLSDLGYLSDWSISAGLTSGYVLPLSRRWNLEFSLGLGYFEGEYKEYNRSLCADCYPWRSTKQRKYIGPTNAAISLTWMIHGYE
jgi:hypothetical protein